MMKVPLLLLIAATLSLSAEPAYARTKCSVFMANFLGLDYAVNECERTPEIEEWIKEERERQAAERAREAKESAAKRPKDATPAANKE